MPLLLVQYIYPLDGHDYKNNIITATYLTRYQLGARGPFSRKSRKIFGPEGKFLKSKPVE